MNNESHSPPGTYCPQWTFLCLLRLCSFSSQTCMQYCTPLLLFASHLSILSPMTTSDHRHLSPATTMSEIPSSKAATRASMHALLLACDSFPVPLTHQQTFPGPSLPLMTITSPLFGSFFMATKIPSDSVSATTFTDVPRTNTFCAQLSLWVNSTHAHCWACLAATGPPSILSICTCSLSNDRHAIHVRSQLKTPPHAAPCRAVACEVYTLTRDASPMSDWSSLGPPLVSIGLTAFVTNLIHMTYMLELEGEC